ncbi:tetratricopeptide repeat protein [Streptomyces sp. NPDC001928]|uniref:tetratricopeptide repeat protein n=1 Tax=Streptomyces sp. NPDC001928 TaxID=3154404 RepID=UPI0033173985
MDGHRGSAGANRRRTHPWRNSPLPRTCLLSEALFVRLPSLTVLKRTLRYSAPPAGSLAAEPHGRPHDRPRTPRRARGPNCVAFEAGLLGTELYGNYKAWFRKVLLIVLPGRSERELPEFLGAVRISRFAVPSLDAAGIEQLVRYMTDQPESVEPELGQFPVYPTGPSLVAAALGAASHLADRLARLGRSERALRLTEDTYRRRRRTLGDDHPDTLRTASVLARRLIDSLRLGEARGVAEETYGRQQRVLGAEHPDTRRTESVLAALRQRAAGDGQPEA